MLLKPGSSKLRTVRSFVCVDKVAEIKMQNVTCMGLSKSVIFLDYQNVLSFVGNYDEYIPQLKK